MLPVTGPYVVEMIGLRGGLRAVGQVTVNQSIPSCFVHATAEHVPTWADTIVNGEPLQALAEVPLKNEVVWKAAWTTWRNTNARNSILLLIRAMMRAATPCDAKNEECKRNNEGGIEQRRDLRFSDEGQCHAVAHLSQTFACTLTTSSLDDMDHGRKNGGHGTLVLVAVDAIDSGFNSVIRQHG
jgi:hypothetical protein